MYRPLGLLVLVLALGLARADDKLPLIFEDDFSKGADRWQPSDPRAWKVIDTKKGKAYSQFKQSKYKPPHRSPLNFALIKDVIVGDFILEAKAQSTVKDYNHRDLCLFFGYQGPAKYYYAHLAKKTDDRANQVFLVNEADRKKISTRTTPGTKWTEGWHHLKVVRKAADGSIAVYFDDMKTPVMTATDRTFTWGRVGLGSFDDTGNWREGGWGHSSSPPLVSADTAGASVGLLLSSGEDGLSLNSRSSASVPSVSGGVESGGTESRKSGAETVLLPDEGVVRVARLAEGNRDPVTRGEAKAGKAWVAGRPAPAGVR
jgi:hypothetical protein